MRVNEGPRRFLYIFVFFFYINCYLDACYACTCPPPSLFQRSYCRQEQVAPPDHPAGTTWVWDDGSGVVLKAEETAQEEIEQRKAEQKEEVSAVA